MQKEISTIEQVMPKIETPALSTIPMIDGHEYVDLGLSVLWATCNVGASKPEEYGDYFTWGETKPMEICTGECVTFRKMIDDIAGDAQYDAARANWGGGWRMPDMFDIIDLLKHCSYVCTNQNGVVGHLFTSKVNGNRLFFPAAGCGGCANNYSAGSFGYYWTSTGGDDMESLMLRMYTFGTQEIRPDFWERCEGYSIRPVID